MHILITGGAGFIGTSFVRMVLRDRPGYHITNLDCLTYSGNLENLTEIEASERYTFVKGDIRDAKLLDSLLPGIDAVVHMAAESHVDRSIMDSGPFVDTNTRGTQVLLDAWRRAHGNDKRFVYVSTDEVYGSLPLDDQTKLFTEDTPLQPNSPYSASKAGGDVLVRAYHHTHGMDVCTTRCSNNFGPWQFPEKVIPLFVTNLLDGKKVPLYGDGRNVRDWLHVEDHCEAVLTVLEKGTSGEVYNVGGNNERSNLELTHGILELMGSGEAMIEYVADRPGHDRRYAIDASKIKRELGWSPSRSAWPGALEDTVRWYADNRAWWERVRTGAYQDYYDSQYAGR
ncbi:MAG: dTDP-glucose 4,6-dehydratase [Planctomycetota bacterium]